MACARPVPAIKLGRREVAEGGRSPSRAQAASLDDLDHTFLDDVYHNFEGHAT
jgi:hypothetical protein